MIGSIKDQNDTLSSAGKTPIDTSYRTNDALKYSAKISSSTRGQNTESKQANYQVKTEGAKKIKGSFEGFVSNKSAYLQPNDVGYANRRNQTARYSQRVSAVNNSKFNNIGLINSKNYSIMSNYSSISLKDSSSDRLNSIVKLNMSFK